MAAAAVGLEVVDGVPGLFLQRDVITVLDEKSILDGLSATPGHVVHQVHTANEYGWRFLKRTVPVSWAPTPLFADDSLGELPMCLQTAWKLCAKFLPAHVVNETKMPDHALVNVYNGHDGLCAHVDDINFWTGWVVGLSLSSGVVMNFAHLNTKVPVWIPPRSIYLLTGDARYKFQHSIDFATHDTVEGVSIPRSTRTSITFRNINPSMLPKANSPNSTTNSPKSDSAK